MAVWHYPLALVPSEAVKDLPSARALDFVSSFATPDGADFSALWQFRQQPADVVLQTVQKFLKQQKDSGSVPLFGSPKRLQVSLSSAEGIVRDLACKIDVRNVVDMRVVLTEILSIAKAHELTGMNEDYGVIPLGDAFHLLRSISQSRAVRYVRDPEGYLNRIHETYKLPPPVHESGAPVAEEPQAEPAPVAETKSGS